MPLAPELGRDFALEFTAARRPGSVMKAAIVVDAGNFEAWLRDILLSFRTGMTVDVPCGECRGCCSAGRFVHLTPSDQSAHAAIPKQLLHSAPGMPKGHAVMGYLADGLCPMLKAGNCSIYSSRPATCRAFDCRVLAAASLQIDEKWQERINERVQAWRFTFSSEVGQQQLEAIRSAADFIQNHAGAFPGGRVPKEPTTIAVLAIKVHTVFLSNTGNAAPVDIANAIVAASKRFEESRS